MKFQLFSVYVFVSLVLLCLCLLHIRAEDNRENLTIIKLKKNQKPIIVRILEEKNNEIDVEVVSEGPLPFKHLTISKNEIDSFTTTKAVLITIISKNVEVKIEPSRKKGIRKDTEKKLERDINDCIGKWVEKSKERGGIIEIAGDTIITPECDWRILAFSPEDSKIVYAFLLLCLPRLRVPEGNLALRSALEVHTSLFFDSRRMWDTAKLLYNSVRPFLLEKRQFITFLSDMSVVYGFAPSPILANHAERLRIRRIKTFHEILKELAKIEQRTSSPYIALFLCRLLWLNTVYEIKGEHIQRRFFFDIDPMGTITQLSLKYMKSNKTPDDLQVFFRFYYYAALLIKGDVDKAVSFFEQERNQNLVDAYAEHASIIKCWKELNEILKQIKTQMKEASDILFHNECLILWSFIVNLLAPPEIIGCSHKSTIDCLIFFTHCLYKEREKCIPPDFASLPRSIKDSFLSSKGLREKMLACIKIYRKHPQRLSTYSGTNEILLEFVEELRKDKDIATKYKNLLDRTEQEAKKALEEQKDTPQKPSK